MEITWVEQSLFALRYESFSTFTASFVSFLIRYTAISSMEGSDAWNIREIISIFTESSASEIAICPHLFYESGFDLNISYLRKQVPKKEMLVGFHYSTQKRCTIKDYWKSQAAKITLDKIFSLSTTKLDTSVYIGSRGRILEMKTDPAGFLRNRSQDADMSLR